MILYQKGGGDFEFWKNFHPPCETHKWIQQRTRETQLVKNSKELVRIEDATLTRVPNWLS